MNFKLVASSYGMTLDEVESRLAYLLDLFDFEGHRYGVIDSFSHGMRQKYSLSGHFYQTPAPGYWWTNDGLWPTSFLWLEEICRVNMPIKRNTVPSLDTRLKWQNNPAIRLPFEKGNHSSTVRFKSWKANKPESTLEEIYLSLAGRQKEWDSHAV